MGLCVYIRFSLFPSLPFFLSLPSPEDTLQSLREMVGYQSILGQVYQHAGQSDVAIDAHVKCRDLQVKVVKMAAMDDSSSVEQEKEKLAKLENILFIYLLKQSMHTQPSIIRYSTISMHTV